MKKLGNILICALILGISFCIALKKGDKVVETIEKPVYIEDLNRIHALEITIQDRDAEIRALKEKVGEVKEVVVLEKAKIDTLSPDSNVLLLREYIEAYTDTDLGVYPFLTSDTLTLLNPRNVKDINHVFLDYFADEELLFNYEEILEIDSLSRISLDSIISLERGIRESIEIALDHERKKKEIWKGIGIGAGVSVIIMGVLCYGRYSN